MTFVPKRVAAGLTKPLSGECGYGTLKIEYAYHTRILFFEEYVRILTYSILAYAYARALQYCM